MKRILIVGGGAGGLELATRLGRRYGGKTFDITLVDRNATHIWKPLLHEVATGALDAGVDELSYRAHAARNRFNFKAGSLVDIDREAQQVTLAPLMDTDGSELLPARQLDYDVLVMAIGSVSNDFGTPGVAEHCTFLDERSEAETFRQQLLNAYLRASRDEDEHRPVSVAIVGGGATGVELSAELFNTAKELASYGLHPTDGRTLKVTLLEASPSILPALPTRISAAAHRELEHIGVEVRTGTRVSEANEQGFITEEGECIEADLCVWAAGIKAPDFLQNIGGLENNRMNQLKVNPNLTTTQDPHILALGDCAACEMPDGSGNVPPRAQAAHQMASYIYKHIKAFAAGQADSVPPYRYRDHGSLVSLSNYSAVGNLMGSLTGKNLMIEGRLARLMYVSLYRMHQKALHGTFKTMIIALVHRLNRAIRPRLKLH